MRFGKNIALLLTIIALLVAALLLTKHLRPQKPIFVGEALFTMTPETITTITWDVVDEEGGESRTVRINRQGDFWRMEEPYAGILCDRAQMTTFIDNIQALKAANTISDASASTFEVARTLTVSTPEDTQTCSFGSSTAMHIAQVLATCRGKLIAVRSEAVERLPHTSRQLWSQAILPVPADALTSIEWRATGQPFIRAIKRDNNVWSVTQPFAFDPDATLVEKALKALTDAQIITAYIRPAPGEASVVTMSETMLAAYGLDEEFAIRVTVRIKGFSDPLQLRFGKADPTRPGHVYCLLDGRQSVVSVPEALKNIFTAEGPFATGHKNIAILGNAITPTSISIANANDSIVATLSHQHGQWRVATPFNLPADVTTVNNLLSALTTMTGDVTETANLSTMPRLCDVILSDINTIKPIRLQFYVGKTDDTLLVFRSDIERLYVFPKAAYPAQLVDLQTLNRLFIDRTLLSLPADSIRRISVTSCGEVTGTIERTLDTNAWNTIAPKGNYVNTATLDAWLTLFSDFKAEEIECEIENHATLLAAYGLSKPHTTICIDLTGTSDQLRRILHISTRQMPDGKIPVMLQGIPFIYTISAESLHLLLQPLTSSERD